MISNKIALIFTSFTFFFFNVNCGVNTILIKNPKQNKNHNHNHDDQTVQFDHHDKDSTILPACNQYDDPNCAQWGNDKKCIKCAYKSYFLNGKCVQSNPLCKTFDEHNGKCTSCYAGYNLNDGNCNIAHTPWIDPLCHKFKDGKCIQCDTRAYFGYDGCCVNVNPLCATFNIYDGCCLTCYSGYKISNGNCVIDLNWHDNHKDDDDKHHKDNDDKHDDDKNIDNHDDC